MAPVCLHSSVIRGCVLNQRSGITLSVHAHVGVSWDHLCEWRGSLRFQGQVTRRHAEWPESLSFFFIALFFSSTSWECRKVGLDERKEWKLLDVDYTECCSACWRQEGISRYSRFPHSNHTVLSSVFPPVSEGKASAVSLDVSSADRQCQVHFGIDWFFQAEQGS